MGAKPTLLILAAGMGSRYGGLKQIDGIGPNGEPIIEYSIYDAIQSGFGKIVFVIRKEFYDDFKRIFDRFTTMIDVRYVFQEVNVEMEGIDLGERTKPWGTSHAVLVAKDDINEPFAVINADDFYGPGSYKILAGFLNNECSKNLYSSVGYILKNTLSEHGTVNRGVCSVDENKHLIEVIERTKIADQDGTLTYGIGEEETGSVDGNSFVSMNYWGFHPSIFDHIEKGLRNFMEENKTNPTAEYYIPNIVTDLIESGQAKVEVLPTEETWFGVTYKEDKQLAIDSINKLIGNKVYPTDLWDN
ncbi:MAG: nucleotidyltransferase [Flavobacteriales bacterium]|nr:nucleotidyltransferase [Flavobacteriales bacterium]